ncbi:MAG: ABC transporter ATP-binding protein [Clostridia bacterium]|nr:ABC transporter ATP-binding protein [Clostridia bacterium]
MDNLMLKVENVSKQYRLGQIGGTTLREELQRFGAKMFHKEDPTKKIGARSYAVGQTFNALSNISFEIKQGERVGIIGHNGAGKSTLLKLISRVTAPTEGFIGINGRVASMLEVGTGFHRELTGRENIYINGAILGMKKSEIDEKIDDIIEFSECSQFIDTPVKRYSSGMYVKLGFSVAAHLNSEILIMDEVLAVGDIAFQKKCLDKMNDVSRAQGKTILYVSHNMNTIKQLCDRCIVLDHGEIIFDGAVDEAVKIYLSIKRSTESVIELNYLPRFRRFNFGHLRMKTFETNNESGIYNYGSDFSGKLTVEPDRDLEDIIMMAVVSCNGQSVMTCETKLSYKFKKGVSETIPFSFSLGHLAPATYSLRMFLTRRDGYGSEKYVDRLLDFYTFDIIEPESFRDNKNWTNAVNGYFVGEEIRISKE